MYATTVNEEDPMNLKESKERHMEGLGGEKWRGKCDYIVFSKQKQKGCTQLAIVLWAKHVLFNLQL